MIAPQELRLPLRFALDWHNRYQADGTDAEIVDYSQTHILLRLGRQALEDLIVAALWNSEEGPEAERLPALACLGGLRRAGIRWERDDYGIEIRQAHR